MDRGIQHGVLAREWVEPDLSALSDLCPALSPADTPALAAASRILAPSSGKRMGVVWSAERTSDVKHRVYVRFICIFSMVAINLSNCIICVFRYFAIQMFLIQSKHVNSSPSPPLFETQVTSAQQKGQWRDRTQTPALSTRTSWRGWRRRPPSWSVATSLKCATTVHSSCWNMSFGYGCISRFYMCVMYKKWTSCVDCKHL